MTSALDDVVALGEYATTRLLDRVAGLTDEEWDWQPVDGEPRISIRRRPDHIAETLDEPRNREFLGAWRSDDVAAPVPAASADAAVTAVRDAAEVALLRDLHAGRAAGTRPISAP